MKKIVRFAPERRRYRQKSGNRGSRLPLPLRYTSTLLRPTDILRLRSLWKRGGLRGRRQSQSSPKRKEENRNASCGLANLTNHSRLKSSLTGRASGGAEEGAVACQGWEPGQEISISPRYAVQDGIARRAAHSCRSRSAVDVARIPDDDQRISADTPSVSLWGYHLGPRTLLLSSPKIRADLHCSIPVV